MMEVFAVDAGYFMADGGALFGVVPKPLWSKYYPVDELNRCKLTMRCMLVVSGSRKVLVDTGAGNKYDDKYLKNNGVAENDKLLDSIAALGITAAEITDVFFTHLHWDHCGGAVIGNAQDGYSLQFPHAVHWVSEPQWKHAQKPTVRDGSAYFQTDLTTLAQSGQMQFLPESGILFPGFEYHLFDGHTPGQALPLVSFKNRKFLFTGDLFPVAQSLPVAWVAGYDLFPVTAMEEKQKLIQRFKDEDIALFFEHDSMMECADVEVSDRGMAVKRSFKLADL